MRALATAIALLWAIAGASTAQTVAPAPLFNPPPTAGPAPPVDARILPASFVDPGPAYASPAIAGALTNPGAPPNSAVPQNSNPPANPPAAANAGECAPFCCNDCGCSPCKCPEPAAPCLPCPRINLASPSWNLLIGGWLEMDMLFNSKRPVAPGVPFFLAPGSPVGNNQATFDAHARQTALVAAFVGPQIGEFKAGGLFMANFFNDAVIVDRYGFLPIQAYGDLKNENWRFAAGLQIDIFAPLLPNVLPFSYLIASGNVGAYRGQLRVERFLRLDDESQITITAGISDPRSTTYSNQILSEDAGWPDIEVRTALALGAEEGEGPLKKRPFEIGLSAVVGQLRTTIGLDAILSNVWGLATDFRWRFTERAGFAGEVYSGQGLGSYGAAVFQTVNTTTGQSIHSTGGWLEVYYYLTDSVHSHVGFGIDNPVASELAASQISLNETIFANLIWDVSKSLRIAEEFTYRDTNYVALNDNNGVGFQTQFQWRF